VGLERSPLSLVSTTEELVGRKSRGSSLGNSRFRPYGIRRADYATLLYPQKWALTSPTSGGLSVGIGRSRTKATEFFYCVSFINGFFATVYCVQESIKLYEIN
jgi:hypothetical protein